MKRSWTDDVRPEESLKAQMSTANQKQADKSLRHEFHTTADAGQPIKTTVSQEPGANDRSKGHGQFVKWSQQKCSEGDHRALLIRCKVRKVPGKATRSSQPC
jgi:hypothetical protein